MLFVFVFLTGLLVDRFGWRYLAILKHAFFDKPVHIMLQKSATPPEVEKILPLVRALVADADKLDAGGMYKRQHVLALLTKDGVSEDAALYAIQIVMYERKAPK